MAVELFPAGPRWPAAEPERAPAEGIAATVAVVAEAASKSAETLMVAVAQADT